MSAPCAARLAEFEEPLHHSSPSLRFVQESDREGRHRRHISGRHCCRDAPFSEKLGPVHSIRSSKS
jgi:hypothetical protein